MPTIYNVHVGVHKKVSLSQIVFIYTRLVPLNMFKPSNDFLLTVPRQCFFCGSFLLFMFYVCLYHTVFSFPCSRVITCWKRADRLALVTFPYGVFGQVSYLIASSLDLCLLFCFHNILFANWIKHILVNSCSRGSNYWVLLHEWQYMKDVTRVCTRFGFIKRVGKKI